MDGKRALPMAMMVKKKDESGKLVRRVGAAERKSERIHAAIASLPGGAVPDWRGCWLWRVALRGKWQQVVIGCCRCHLLEFRSFDIVLI